MPSCYKTKVIFAGTSESGKNEFFQNCSSILTFNNSSLWNIGVSFKIADYIGENGDKLTMSIWDINGNQRFKFLHGNFFRGAVGGLIFFDPLNATSYIQLHYWIDSIRNNTESIPIFLVGKEPKDKRKIDFGKIRDFLETYHLNGFYLVDNKSSAKNEQIISRLAQRILDNIESEPSISDLEAELDPYEKETYEKFLDFFSKCPLCSNTNHTSYLKKFYFTQKKDQRKLRDELIFLMEDSKVIKNHYKNEITVGIPCCSCFNQIFQNN